MIRLSILASVLFCNMSWVSAGLVLATFLDGADGTTGLYTYNDAAIGATVSSVTLDVQSDRNGDGRIFGGMGMARPIMDFSAAGKEVHIEFRTLGFNQQATMTFGLRDADTNGDEKHEFNVSTSGGTPTTDGFRRAVVDLSQPADFIFRSQDGIANFGLNRWELQSRFADGLLPTPGQSFGVEIRAMQLVAVPESGAMGLLAAAVLPVLCRRRRS